MFIYSRAMIDKILQDVKKFIFIITLLMETFYIAYLIYSLAIGAGIFFANVTLLALSCAYATFTAVNQIKTTKLNKKDIRSVKKTYRIAKICVNAFTLGATLYGIVIASSAGTASIILAALTTIMWLFSVLFEIAVAVFDKYKELVIAAFEKDIRPIVKWIPGVDAPHVDVKDSVNQKIEALGDEFEDKLKAKKIIRKAEKKIRKQEKRKELHSVIAGKIKSLLPKKKQKNADADSEKKLKSPSGKK